MIGRLYTRIVGAARRTVLRNKTTFTFSAATLSLIDPITSLPVTDSIEPGIKIDRRYITGNKYYRFANFLEAKIDVSEQGKITSCGLTPSSGLYRDISFLNDESEAFPSHQFKGSQPMKPLVSVAHVTADHTFKFKMPGIQGRRWVQTAGARTKTSDDIGKLTGSMPLTNELALPPIWSTLRLSIFANGIAAVELIYHSLFPSVWYYVQDDTNPDKYNFIDMYFGSPHRLLEWREAGFGTILSLKEGPNRGNPWRMQSPHTFTKMKV